ncbi:hypothetical protein I7I53_04307 [Histoplasma capsulatum var. duboisii H88]|uniref:Uncharacterized protein n=1 Tax=Ajellomyces capsulatus (strain H88) TaxID=544711 RepID=A0A8A1LUA7_AJEC8|nr:hypothetical protein I7I53_04307 [Histoplasma capsulatum var. duboisii H88]
MGRASRGGGRDQNVYPLFPGEGGSLWYKCPGPDMALPALSICLSCACACVSSVNLQASLAGMETFPDKKAIIHIHTRSIYIRPTTGTHESGPIRSGAGDKLRSSPVETRCNFHSPGTNRFFLLLALPGGELGAGILTLWPRPALPCPNHTQTTIRVGWMDIYLLPSSSLSHSGWQRLAWNVQRAACSRRCKCGNNCSGARPSFSGPAPPLS